MDKLCRIAFSFIVDADPRFAYEGWHLAHSLMQHCAANAKDIHVQFTSDVDPRTVDIFASIGCNVATLERFGDGKYCNKLAQWSNLSQSAADHFIFLDTDMIVVADCRSQLPTNKISAKIVDLPNPPLEVLSEVLTAAGFSTLPDLCNVDASVNPTYVGNCNGGLYSVPRQYSDTLFSVWQRWALWLLNHNEPLVRAGKESHVDQISFCLALHETGLPFALAPSNVNYFIHFAGEHSYFDSAHPISILHYHNESLNVTGVLEPKGAVTQLETEAVAAANREMGKNFDNRIFWDLRYMHFLERGSGVGSRGANLEYKRQLLRDQEAERAKSVLDFGCGDLEVVKALSFRNYVGIDHSPTALGIAKLARPDWTFLLAPAKDAPPCDLVLCFEVLIHQETVEAYRAVIDYLVGKTEGALLVSGYEACTEAIRDNPMVFFYEPLSESLSRSGKFKSITVAGTHSDVVIFRCAAKRRVAGSGLKRLLSSFWE